MKISFGIIFNNIKKYRKLFEERKLNDIKGVIKVWISITKDIKLCLFVISLKTG